VDTSELPSKEQRMRIPCSGNSAGKLFPRKKIHRKHPHEYWRFANDQGISIQQFRVHRPDVTLMDLQMPEMSGLDALIAIRGEFPEARIIVLTTYRGDVQVLRAMKAGARAYLVKNLMDDELLGTVRDVHAGKRRLSTEASYELAEHAAEDALTQPEVDILRLIAAGNANKQIAAKLSLTEETVKGRVKNILSKLGASDRTHAATIGIKRGIIEP